MEWKSLTNKKIGMFMPSVSMHEPTAQFGFWNYNERVYMLSTGAGLRGRELTLKKKINTPIIIIIIIIIIFTDGYRTKTNHALCTGINVNSNELAQLKQNTSSQVKLSA